MRGSARAVVVVCALAVAAGGQEARDYAVRVSAEIQRAPSHLTLRWVRDEFAQGYEVCRKIRDATTWGTVLATLGVNDTSWVDTTIALGQAFEYRVYKRASTYTGYGYLYGGIEVPARDSAGTVLLLVDDSQAAALVAELSRLQLDLIAEGWRVVRRDVSRTAAVTEVKATIQQVRAAAPSLEAVFIVGHVPVPYSGNLNPDGHPDHLGAWPADVYYGEMDGSWTDNTVSDTVASRAENDNVPGDGKFDQTTIPGTVELAVGRADLANMATFTGTETDLLRRYLDKDHAYRSGATTYLRRAFIDDNFGGFSGEAFAATGWRNFTAMFGPSAVGGGDVVHTAAAQSYLWAYGCGAGSYTSASGIGSTTNMAACTLQVVFTSLFGSYFGDWDIANNFLRSPLASRPSALVCFWAGRPHWYLHHMALGEPIGFSTRLTQNNTALYVTGSSSHRVHIGLMGDPTLRLHVVKPAAGLALASFSGRVAVSWTSSPDTVIGYHVYRSRSLDSAFARVSGTPVTATAFVDSSPGAGRVTYMVRALKLEQSASGTYYNLSPGVIDSVTVSTGVAVRTNTRALPVDVRLSGRVVRISGLCGAAAAVCVLDMGGRVVRRVSAQSGTHSLDLRDLPSGAYVVSVEASSGAVRRAVGLW